jgi:AmmeMemoRadiSam system protein A
VAGLKDGTLVRTIAGVHDREHAIEIELPFLQERLGEFCLVPLLASRTDAESQQAMASRLAALHDGKTLFVFSTDFTHYGPRFGYTPFGPSAVAVRDRIRKLDERALGYFSPPNAAGFRAFLEETADTICGRHGLGVLLELIPRIAPRARLVRLATYASIDLPGFADDNSVSYASLAYFEGEPPAGAPLTAVPDYAVCPAAAPPLDPALGQGLLQVARATVESELLKTHALRQALAALPADRSELDCLQAAFVTLNRTDPEEIARHGKLRGCIGQVSPIYPLPEAVVVAARGAALEDRRFNPVRAAELPGLSVELTVLSPPRPVGSWQEIVIGTHGIVLHKGGRRAVYLPHVATEQGWDLEETLSRLSRKAGLPRDGWREGATFEVFEGQVFAEHTGVPSQKSRGSGP